MQEVQRMPVVQITNKSKPKRAQEKKKAKLAAAKAKTKAVANPKADPKKKAKKTKAITAGDSPESPAPPADPSDLKATIAALRSDVNKYKQQAQTARDKLEATVGATKPSKAKLCNHF